MSVLGLGVAIQEVSCRLTEEQETQPRTSSRAWMANEVSQTCEPLVPCMQRMVCHGSHGSLGAPMSSNRWEPS